MGLFFTSPRQRSTNLPELIDAAGRFYGRRGLTGSPVAVGWSNAQAIPAVLDAVRLRHDLIATMPVQVFRRRADGRAEEVDPPAVLQQPEAASDILGWLAASQKSLDMRGNAYGIIVARDARNLPTQIELQHPDKVEPRIDRDGLLYFRISGKRYEVTDVWHERCHDEPGTPIGLSPIGVTARSLGINLAAEQFGADFFRDGAHPTALLTSEAPFKDEADAKVAKRRFMDAVADRREPVVLDGNWKYEALSVNPAEAQFLEVMGYGDVQVARIFNVLPELIGGAAKGSSVTYANREQRALDFLTYRLGPAITRRERALSRLTPRGQFVKLNRGSLLATDVLTRYKSYEIGLKNGFLAMEEPRLLEDRLPLTDGQLDALKDAGLLGKPTSPAPAENAPAATSTEA